MRTEIASLGAGAIGTLALVPAAIRFLRARGIVDQPGPRSSHSYPTVRGAGLATGPVLAVALGAGWDRVLLATAAAVLLAALLGVSEDVHGIPVVGRLVGQAISAAAFLALAWDVGAPMTALIAVAALFFMVSYINAFNFMDGINGISAVSAAMAGLTYIALGQAHGMPDLRLSGLALVAVAVCFLPFNFPKARVFLGDSGSYSFGAAIACAAVTGWREGLPVEAVLAPLAVYLADTGITLLWRMAHRASVTTPHRDHTYQRLVALGRTHAHVTGIVLAFTLTLALLGLTVVGKPLSERLAVDAAGAVVVLLYLELPSLLRPAQSVRRRA